MYEHVKSKVVTLQGESNFFKCSVGVRQGEKLSPFLFSIYLNELESFLSEKGVTGVRRHVDEAHLYLKLFILLYADDTAIDSDNETDFRLALGSLKNFLKVLQKLKDILSNIGTQILKELPMQICANILKHHLV